MSQVEAREQREAGEPEGVGRGQKTMAYGQLPVFGNKVLLEPNHALLLTYCLWLLPIYKGRVEQLGQTKNQKENSTDSWFRRSGTR